MNIKQLFLSTCLITLSCASVAQHSPSIVSSLAEKSMLLDVTQSNKTLIAVGERGHLLRSDNGADWQQLQSPVNTTLTSVAAESNNIWAVGHDATILYSADNGDSWSVQYSDTTIDKPLLDVEFFDPQNGIAIGAYGLFLRTNDGGQSWTQEIHTELLFEEDLEYLEELKEDSVEDYELELESILPHFNQVVRSGNTLLMVGEMGLVASSSDFGSTWSKLNVNYEGSFFSVAEFNGDIYLGGLRGTIFRKRFSESAFEKIDLQGKASFNAIFSQNDRVFLVGNNGMVVSIDDVAVSEFQIPEEKAILNGVYYNGMFVLATDIGILTTQSFGK